MTNPFPRTYVSVIEALDFVGRHRFQEQWTGQEIAARHLTESGKTTTPLQDDAANWPAPGSAEYKNERAAHLRHRAACRILRDGLRYGHIASWLVNNLGERTNIPQEWWVVNRVSVGAFIGSALRARLHLNLDTCRIKQDDRPKSRRIDLRSLLRDGGDKGDRLFIDKEGLDGILGKEQEPAPNDQALTDSSRRKGGSRPKYNQALQQAVNLVKKDLARQGKKLALKPFENWIDDNTRNKNTPDEIRYSFDPPIPDCDDLCFDGQKLTWQDSEGVGHDISPRSLAPYFKRAKAS